MRWTPDGKRKRGRLRETWTRSVALEMKEQQWRRGQVTEMANVEPTLALPGKWPYVWSRTLRIKKVSK